MKKILSFIFACAIMLQCTAFVSAENTKTQNDTIPYKVLCEEDFEGKQNAITRSSGTAGVRRADEEHGNAMFGSAPGAGAVWYVDFEEPVKSGVLYVGYDFWRSNMTGLAYDCILNSPTGGWAYGRYISLLWGGQAGGITYYLNLDPDDMQRAHFYDKTYLSGEWHHVDLWYDMDKRVAMGYLDGNFFFETTMNEEIDKITTAGRIMDGQEVYSNGVEECVDNYNVYHFEKTGGKISAPGIVGIPEYLQTPVILELETGDFANNLFGKEFEFDLKLKNVSAKKANPKISINIKDDSGIEVLNETVPFDMAMGAEEIYKLKFNAPRYGHYFVDIKAEYDNGASPSYINTRLTVMKPAEKQNPAMGVSDHYYMKGMQYMPEKLTTFKNAGMYYSREEFFWEFFEDENGNFNVEDKQKKVITTMKENGIEHFPIWSGVGAGRRPDISKTEVPFYDEDIANVRDYAYNSVLAHPDAKYWEVWNEVDNKPMYNPRSEEGYKQYVKLMKACYEGAKAANPDVIVVGGVWSLVPFEWIEGVLRNGGGQYCDAFSTHPYSNYSSPEAGKLEENIDKMRELMDKYGCENHPIIISELGWSAGEVTKLTEEHKLSYTLRSAAMLQPRVDVLIWYCGSQKEMTSLGANIEAGFGLIDRPLGTEIPSNAKPALIGLSNWNNLMTNATFDKKLATEDADEAVYKFKTEDGRDVLMVWSVAGFKNEMSLNLGADTVELMDIYGNSKTVKAINGRFDITLGLQPQYIIGRFDKVEFSETTFDFEQDTLNLIPGEKTTITLKTAGDAEQYELSVRTPNNVKMYETKKINDTIKVDFMADGTSDYEYDSAEFIVCDKSGNVVFSEKLRISYVEPIVYDAKVLPYNENRLMAEINFTNQKSSAVALELEVTEPLEMAGMKKTIETVIPGDTRVMRFDVAKEYTYSNNFDIKGKLKVKGDITEEYDLSVNLITGFIKKTETVPVIDGVLESGEWQRYLPAVIDGAHMVREMSWDGSDDLSAKIYMMSDDNYFYMALEAKDDIHFDKDAAGRIWANDSVQIAFTDELSSRGGRSEFAIGEVNGIPKIGMYSSLPTKEDLNVFSEDTKVMISRDESTKTTIYEAKIPWTEIYKNADFAKGAKSHYVSFLMNDNDGPNVNNQGTGRGWLEYCGGIGSAKNAAEFIEFPVIKKPSK